MTTFKDLPIGQKFRLINWPGTEWVKTRLTVTETTRYNAIGDDGRTRTIGHGAKVMIPPYAPTAKTSAQKQKERYASLLARVQAAGWKSPAEFETAIINGIVDVPMKGEI